MEELLENSATESMVLITRTRCVGTIFNVPLETNIQEICHHN